MERDFMREVRKLAAVREIENLQGRYMYWLEGHRYDRVLSCFARQPDVSVEIGDSGVYVGSAKVAALFVDVLKPFFTMPGMMPLHMLTTPVIEADVDAGRGAGMWQTLGCNSFPTAGGDLEAVWQQGPYDNLYIVEDGEWRILRMRWLANFRTRFDRGWVRDPMLQLASLDPGKMTEAIRPDLPGSAAFDGYDPAAVRARATQPPEK